MNDQTASRLVEFGGMRRRTPHVLAFEAWEGSKAMALVNDVVVLARKQVSSEVEIVRCCAGGSLAELPQAICTSATVPGTQSLDVRSSSAAPARA